MAPKRIGLIGAGWVTQHHLAGYRELGADRVQVVAIADPNEAARQRRAAEFRVPATYADAAEMLERERLDAVDIAAPREFHAPMCLLAARHKLPILCQKPLTPTLAESEALVKELGGRVRLMVHENWRFRPHFRTIKRWLDEGRIGPLRQAIMIVLGGTLGATMAGTATCAVRRTTLPASATSATVRNRGHGTGRCSSTVARRNVIATTTLPSTPTVSR